MTAATGATGGIALERTLTQAEFDAFAELSGDHNPIHVDAEFAAATRFGRTVAHGALLCSILRALTERLVPGARQLDQQVMFPAPSYAGEALRFSAAIVTRSGDRIAVSLRAERVSDGTVTCEGRTTLAAGGVGP